MLIPILQIITAIALIVLILLQERSAGLSGIFGGEGGAFYQTRRGLERGIFWGTIILAVIFVGLAILGLIG
ncbi:MAG: preprotein translocase subunit SecG [Candidatus Liptonbacteria bacterium GWB1_49_6]|uniref:Protein-export membrane protein SecG n=1 Tax=Candidatus Liptonbacteria bacterium GWB1_49_6 TaxID=1798644 RepID=A0A1G2C9H6_9BACT|nr:MAG: preprotein translocase subunit SecG [Candidatus Liptonbacteria bacterium GWB1_49_6]